jgi:uncharacterized membrane protein
MNQVLILAVYVLGALTVFSFLVFVVLLVRYLKTNRTVAVPAPVASPVAAPGENQLQGIDPAKIFDSLGKALEASAKLAKALNEARPVALAALLTILFLLGWLMSLTLLIAKSTP